MQLPSLSALEDAARRVHAVMPPTPQFAWPLLRERLGLEVWVKHENHTEVGAFKLRGGLLYFDELVRRQPALTGVVAATRGNHGQSVAFAARRHGLHAVVVVPEGNSRSKNAAMRAQGAELVEHGRDFQAALDYAAQLAQERGLHLVPSFAEPLVRGVATAALELFQAVPALDALYVPIGLGSGVCAAIAARDALGLKTQIVGVTATAAPTYARSYAARQVVSADVAPTVADGVACRTADPAALEVILRGMARLVAVDEADIRGAMRCLFADTHNIAEGAGAVALAGLRKERAALQGRKAAVMLTGGNIDDQLFASVLGARD